MTFCFKVEFLKVESCAANNGRSADSAVPRREKTEATCLTSVSQPHYVVIILPSAAPFSFGLITFFTLFSICFIPSVLAALPCLPPTRSFFPPLLTSLMTSSLPLFCLQLWEVSVRMNKMSARRKKKKETVEEVREKSERLPAGAAAAKK